MHCHHIFIKRIEKDYFKEDFRCDINSFLEPYEYKCYDYYHILFTDMNKNDDLYNALKRIKEWQIHNFKRHYEKIDFKNVEKECEKLLDTWNYDENLFSERNALGYYLKCISEVLNDEFTFDCAFVDMDNYSYLISNELLEEVKNNPTDFMYAEVDLHL